MCPHCHSPKVVRKGFHQSHQGRKTLVQRYRCKACLKYYSDQTTLLSYREKKSYLDQPLFRILDSGVSQRRAARIFGIHPTTIQKKIIRLSTFAQKMHAASLKKEDLAEIVVFDEMETFEHTKMKPLSIAVAVVEGRRKILSMQVAQMPAKGLLAAKSRKKYGVRPDKRPKALLDMLHTVKQYGSVGLKLKSDESPRYPHYVAKVFEKPNHETFKGRRGCVVGQGELKAGGFDPLFSLNHTCAMARDNIKRLSRKTWCTTKRPDMLQHLLNLYICYHNQTLDKKNRLPVIANGGGAIK